MVIFLNNTFCVFSALFQDSHAYLTKKFFTGEVLVWDLSREDDLVVATSGIGDDAHREPVTKVHWIKSQSSKKRDHNVRSFIYKIVF